MSSKWADTPLLAAVETEAIRILELARAGDLSAPIVHLSRWKARDVVAHLGGVHRWATRVITTSSMDGPSFTKSKLDGYALCDWFEEGATDLVAAFSSKSPDDACPNFNPGSEKVLAWWARRQAHETTVHRWDMESAYFDTTAIDSELAADGVDEFLDVFVRTRGKQTLTETLVLATREPERSWTLRPAEKAGRIDVFSGRPDAASSVQVVAGAEQLLLALWGRLGVVKAGLDVRGDVAVVHHLINA